MGRGKLQTLQTPHGNGSGNTEEGDRVHDGVANMTMGDLGHGRDERQGRVGFSSK